MRSAISKLVMSVCLGALGGTSSFSAPEPLPKPSGEESTPAVAIRASSDTPARDVIVATMEALRRADRRRFLEGFDYTDTERRMLESLVDFSSAALRFRKRFVDEYGRLAWEVFQNPQLPPGAHDFRFSHISDEQMEALRQLDEADLQKSREVALPNTGGFSRLVEKEGGGWLIDAGSLLPEGQSPSQFANIIRAMIDAVERHIAVIGIKGIDPEDIDHDIGLSIDREIGSQSEDLPRIDPAILKDPETARRAREKEAEGGAE